MSDARLLSVGADTVLATPDLRPIPGFAAGDAKSRRRSRARLQPVPGSQAERSVPATFAAPFLPVSQPDLTGNELAYVTEAVTEGWISGSGRYLDRFEQAFSDFCGVPHALGVCNGTAALHLLLAAMGIQTGDEVIVPALTYVASANAVAYTGARPVFVDAEPCWWQMDPEKLQAAITPRTRAIMAVHLYGHPSDMKGITTIADRHGLAVIEDASEAHGAAVDGVPVGGLGTGASFSFYGNKILTTGEGGMVTTRDASLARRMRLLRGQGMDPQRRYWFPVMGYNYRMTNLEAAIGAAQMERVGPILKERARVAATYERLLAPHAGPLGIRLPQQADWAQAVCWLYSICVEAGQRDPLMAHLASVGIETRPFFPPLHLLPMYNDGSRHPVAEHLGACGLNLPTYGSLDEGSIKRVVSAVTDFLGARG